MAIPLVINQGEIVSNEEEFVIDGDIDNSGTINNLSDGIIEVNIPNTIINQDSGTINNDGKIALISAERSPNNGFLNYGLINNNNNGIIDTNRLSIKSYGTIK